MKTTVLGASGRTGRLLVAELARRGHDVTVLVRDPASAPPGAARTVVGDARDPAALAEAVAGADAVVSALGPQRKESDLHRTVVRGLLPALREAGVQRYVAVGGAGMNVPGDRKRLKDRVVSRVMHLLGGAMVDDKYAEYSALRDSDLQWTVVRPPMLSDGPATGRVEHDPHVSTQSVRLTRGDLAAFLADVVEQGTYVGQAPFVATARS